jgi:hypothetical protein
MDFPPVPCELCQRSARPWLQYRYDSYVATGEVTTLEHELRDDTVELGAGVAEALLASAESAEVLSGLGDNVVVEGEVDAAAAGCERVRSAWCFDGN